MGTLPAIAVALLILPSTAAAAVPTAGLVYEPSSWTNGQVLCEFVAGSPEVTVSALSRDDSGMVAAAGSLTEVAPGAALVATANLTAANWTVSNNSTSSAYVAEYSSTSLVVALGAKAVSLGLVHVSVEFVLPIVTTVSSPSLDNVTMNVSVSGWPWQSDTDHLAMTLDAWPAYSSGTMALGTGGGLMAGVTSSGGAIEEQLFGATSATADPGSPGATTVAATPSVSGNASEASVSIAFGSNAGSFSSLGYSMNVHVLLPSHVAGIPIADFGAAAAGAGAVAAVLAVATGRIRARPSRLTFVDEEKP